VRRALAWAAGVTAAEALARAVIPSRARAWIWGYGALGLATSFIAGQSRRNLRAGLRFPEAHAHISGATARVGVGLSLVGYPLGRRLLGDAPGPAPVDGLALDLLALAIVVPLAEEQVWGARVEPNLGIPKTAALFALKHVTVDRRWRRALGLAAFWAGLGLVRKRSPRAAAALHCACNAGAVVWGHASDHDQF
jgi:hypothetical protein